MPGRRPLADQLAQLEAALVPWLASAPHPAAFWPQFQALADEIRLRAAPAERPWVDARIERMLQARAAELPLPLEAGPASRPPSPAS
ncbi:hypothetical protein [Pseudoxanthomonas dokdonensis]|uniref:Uncharacterized protein n=1 Tax=Pseudoxanthomonas dokdonensis TaxID=344882 RepID=A0A0R0CMG1_9GAMM|nr:hypothetical protein [Pseudoxanthomonas dokdonensis]KRG70598.1 hypothetical protein ABB29_05925 [Pseudoxanthomonas dokdonensis]